MTEEVAVALAVGAGSWQVAVVMVEAPHKLVGNNSNKDGSASVGIARTDYQH